MGHWQNDNEGEKLELSKKVLRQCHFFFRYKLQNGLTWPRAQVSAYKYRSIPLVLYLFTGAQTISLTKQI